ncbi:ABC transporter ATP-binding protein [Paraclostridium sordellii]|uniref:Multidrug ABC transporter ATPase n=1 Tax=Paraclostridium sordellii TaxID=1505 RepID=A0A9P1KX25_PARSO|nr:ATP-binding cassette domain-containing protein [Paeniclostridium sordellii]CEN31359.1 multidrug ABC transporter ATPase [[Clostridium] sordellii] [Paeniclostridium sordellii]
MNLITLLNVEKKIKHKYILKNINLEIEKGKIYGFIGHNGCGKTMLFRAICNFINITKGEILVNGIKIKPDVEYPIKLGALIEYPGFIESYSGIKNLEYLSEINKYIGKEEIIEVLKEVGLYDFKDEKVKKYSLGMKQKLGIAQAIMEDQELLIFDEPINALDDFSIDVFRNIINKKKNEGKTILISSHNKEKLEDLFDFTVKMSNGEIVEVIKEKMNE